MDTAADVMNASVDSFSGFAAKYAEGNEKAQERVTKFLDTVGRLRNKDRELWDKRDKDDAKWVDEFLKALKEKKKKIRQCLQFRRRPGHGESRGTSLEVHE